jgi:NADH dehydrogenase
LRLVAILFDWIPAFPVTRDQLTVLCEGNTADSDGLAGLIGESPTSFDLDSLKYLASDGV